MSAERDELIRLVEAIPDNQLPRVLDDVRKHLTPAVGRATPPAATAGAGGLGAVYGVLGKEPSYWH